jgi:flagellar export protein FliJ
VLDYRHSRVQVEEIELGHLTRLYQEAEARLAELQSAQVQGQSELRRKQTGTMDLSAIAYLRAELKRREQHILEQATALADLATRLAYQQASLVQARQAEETLATLKDKGARQYQAILARNEANQRDDVYIAQAHRRAQAAPVRG